MRVPGDQGVDPINRCQRDAGVFHVFDRLVVANARMRQGKNDIRPFPSKARNLGLGGFKNVTGNDLVFQVFPIPQGGLWWGKTRDANVQRMCLAAKGGDGSRQYD